MVFGFVFMKKRKNVQEYGSISETKAVDLNQKTFWEIC